MSPALLSMRWEYFPNQIIIQLKSLGQHSRRLGRERSCHKCMVWCWPCGQNRWRGDQPLSRFHEPCLFCHIVSRIWEAHHLEFCLEWSRTRFPSLNGLFQGPEEHCLLPFFKVTHTYIHPCSFGEDLYPMVVSSPEEYESNDMIISLMNIVTVWINYLVTQEAAGISTRTSRWVGDGIRLSKKLLRGQVHLELAFRFIAAWCWKSSLKFKKTNALCFCCLYCSLTIFRKLGNLQVE